MINTKRLLNNLLTYVKIDTQSVPDATAIPSSPGQLELAKIVANQFEDAGFKEIKLSESGYLFATIPSNLSNNKKVPTIGFVAHFDTAAEVSGKNVKPQVIENYNGQKITFSGNKNICLDPSVETNLKSCIGHTIITTDGTTLLGGDDKAGIAALLELAHYFKDNPKEQHGKIRIAIMPDEETAAGAHKLDLKTFGADVVYTLDGSFMGDIDVESFNGFKAKVTVEGNSAFPGYGKGVYLSATRVLGEFVAEMPDKLWPENCEKRDPIWWADEFKGGVGQAEMTVYLRNFDLEGIKEQENELNKIKEKLLKKYPKAKISVSVSEMYKNFKEILNKDKRVIEFAKEAVKRAGIAPNPQYVRGGSDACHFCFSGIMSTNIFIGMQQMHSLKEWISLNVIEKSAETAINLAKVWAEKS